MIKASPLILERPKMIACFGFFPPLKSNSPTADIMMVPQI